MAAVPADVLDRGNAGCRAYRMKVVDPARILTITAGC